MENFEDVLSKLLSSEEGMAGLEEFMKTMGMTGEQSTHENSSENEKKSDNNTDDLFGGINIEAIMKLGEMFSKMNKPDKNTALLIALKPHLREENQKKIDTAVKLFKLISMLPTLKESGLFDNLF